MASPTRRHPLEIFDVTIRDGSYTIDFQFNQEDVRFLYPALEALGFRYIEVGHGFGLNASSVKGLAAATDEEYLSAAAEARKSSRFGTFFIPSIAEKEHMRAAREDFGMDFIRIGNDADKIESTLEYVEYAKSLGYEVMSNFMKTYGISPAEFARKAKALAEEGTDVVYLVDSAGCMLPNEVGEYVKAVADETDVRIGFHAHNNLELAGANALRAWENGCTLVDCSIGGLGRSAGNARTELFIPIMRQLGVQFDYDFIEVLRVWQDFILPIQHRRKPTSRAVATGYARVHSGLIAPFVEASAKHGIEIEAILEAFGDALYSGNATPSVEEAVKEVSQTRKTRPSHSESVLLKIGPSHGDPASIRNTFHSVDEVLNAVNALSKKAYLPVALVVSIEAVAPDEPYVAAEYLYHDEHFIVIHAMFSSVSLFVEVKRKYRGRFEILVFDRLSPSGLSALEARRSDWRQGERVVHLDSRICKYHYLFSILYQIA
ncbi:MAG TPA: hypothetical protein VM492_02040, partial [Sumerlaeia bacterium]|nr:hypothetical protein [Sumerlaeia bacterium]